MKGKGLQTGKPVEAFFYPAADGEGISFVRKDLKKKPPIRLLDLGCLKFDADRRSIVRADAENYVETVEHLLAALWGAGISNIKIELDSSEPPAMDGSAREFLEALKKAGIKKQNSEKSFIKIKEPVWVEEKNSFLGIFPSDIYKISYIFEHPYAACGRQSFSEVLSPDLFREKIAPARTLWFVPPGPGTIEEKAEAVRKQGYGRGADSENTLVIDENKIVNLPRFPDEPVRHGVLDLIGDLYLLNRPIRGRIIAIRSGHKLNLELVKKINERYACK
ncbi:MAG: UDP-3-O-acyl-N-acetylglucosamine deacetylase [Omnitrophica bacterium]|nr:UDP-3-O-acyl-N-acetylglucosamine deacetylase [Candidatus Omnitrophota bacterium]